MCHWVHLGAFWRACSGVYLRTYTELYLGVVREHTWEHMSNRLGVCHQEKLRTYSQAGWECAIECIQKITLDYTWEHALKCIWLFAFKFVLFSEM